MLNLLYQAAQAFVERALRTDDSLFTPGRRVWTIKSLDDLHTRFIQNEDGSNAEFLDKWEKQLTGAQTETIQLAAELLCVHFLIPTDVSATTKAAQVQRVLDWMPQKVTVPDDLAQAYAEGVARVGAALAEKRNQLRFLLEFVQSWKRLPRVVREEALTDPWKLQSVVDAIPAHRATVERNGLLHLIHPQAFQPIVSQRHKAAIATAFSNLVSDLTADLDHRLLAIREGLAAQYGEGERFYRADVKHRWQPETAPWGQFVGWAARFFYRTDFDAEERDYKLRVADNLRHVREAIQADAEGWLPLLKKAFDGENNLTSFHTHSRFLAWCQAEPEAAQDALRAFWETNQTVAERIRTFGRAVPKEALNGMLTNPASFLAMAVDPTQYPIYQQTVYQDGLRLTGATPPPAPDGGALYDHYLEFLDRLLKELHARGVPARDRLDAQSLLWCVTRAKLDKSPVASWPVEERERLAAYRAGQVPGPKPVDEDENRDAGDADPIESLAERLLLDTAFLRRIVKLLQAKHQIILYGPPGTGKTYVAKELANVLAEPGGAVELIQFHPSYAYEDFVEGYRPVPSQNGQPTFALVPGPLKRLAERARNNPHGVYILIIDEINRGNLPKVFGELFYLLEYRDQKITLQYSAEPFSLPQNLWIIGTMNTADRSIAILDAALRRRFAFVPFFPTETPLDGLLERWLKQNKTELLWVAEVVKRANALLADRHAAIGPSYFLRPDLDEEWVNLIWDHEVLPTLAERFYGDEARVADFALTKLRSADPSGP